MRTIWFSEWTNSPMHKVVYQTAIGSAVAVGCVAFMEITGVPLNAKRWLALPVSTIAVFATGFLIHSFVWRKFTPYVTLEGSRLLHSQEAVSAPLRARFWLGTAWSLILASGFLIIFDIWHGGPIWRLTEMPSIAFLGAIIWPVAVVSQRPFNKLLPGRRIETMDL